ncbi:MAG TPA: deoxyribose-phosphate aldolase [Geminicoccaceae bacterium]
MATTPHDLIERAARATGDAAAAARILPLLDLTSLNDDDTEAEVETLCARAIDAGVAAVCVWPRFLPVAQARLARSPIRLATVANFPDGSDDLERAARETAAALAAGADEVDVVAPIQAVLDGDIGLVTELVQACRKAAPDVTLKVILETGRLAEPARIAAAARAAIMGGCDMLKTSTGKVVPGATLEAAAVLLAVIEEADGRVGVKLAGGIRTTQHAARYLYLVDHFLGSGWTSPATLRFGASALLDDLLKILRSE